MKLSDEEKEILLKTVEILSKRRTANKVFVPISNKNGNGVLSFDQGIRNYDLLENKILQWHMDRNLIDGSTDKKQFEKLLEEVEELRQSIEAGVSPVDDIGDIIVVLVNIAARNNLSLEECTEYAYNSIKTRAGRMVDGIFIKDGD